MLENIITWLEAHMASCYYKKYLGIECLGCGFQRAFIELLKGNFANSFALFPALIPTIFLFLFLLLHLKLKFRYGAQILQNLFIFTVSVMVLSFLYKIITH